MLQKITPHLWFAKDAEKAVEFYSSVFDGGKVLSSTKYLEAGKEIHGMEPGSTMSVHFELEGYKFLAINAGPVFSFTPAISFMVHCPNAEDVQALWDKLLPGGKVYMEIGSYPFSDKYGWIGDKYGVTWQLIHDPRFTTRKIVPNLMYAQGVAGKAEEAMKLYASLFEDSEIKSLDRYPEGSGKDTGTIMYGEFKLAGEDFSGMDSAGTHAFTFTEAISLLVTCKNQGEIDHFWNALSASKESEQCGWLKDKFGVSWQIVPAGMEKMMNDPDRAATERAMGAMMQMKKLDIAKLQAAHEGK